MGAAGIKHPNAFERTPEFVRGHENELKSKQRWTDLGYAVTTTYAFTPDDDRDSKAPKLLHRSGSYALPDLHLSSPNGWGHRYVEVKLKAAASDGIKSGKPEHGINLRLYRDYLKVEALTGTPVLLEITEQDTGDVLLGRLQRLDVREYTGTLMGRDGMAFLLRDELLPFDAFAYTEERMLL